MTEQHLPSLLQFLSEELNYDVFAGPTTLGYELFYIDLSAWKLRLSHRTLVIWVQTSDLTKFSPRQVIQSLQDVIREQNLERQTVLVLFDDDSEPLLQYTLSPLYNLVIIDREDQKKVAESRRPTGELRDIISAQVSIANLAPYETSAPVTGSRFFGREYEISRILANPDTNYAILGIRRIGKTSLLQEIERILREDEDSPHIAYLDCSDLLSTDEYIREVVRKLNPRELRRLHLQKYAFFFPDFLERMSRKYGSKIVFLLDEIDSLIIMQRGNWELFRMLRASANKGACQYIIAGFREAMREQHLLDAPFYNFAEEIRLQEFTRKQAYDLVVTPMENLGVHFRNRNEVVGRIYEETAGHPNLIQYYCKILLKQLDQNRKREITPDSLIDVYADEGFKNHLLTSFTLNTQNRERALVYALLRDAGEDRLHGFSQPYLDAALRKRGIVLPQNQIDEACHVLTLAGVLHRKGREYSFTSPVFAKVLQQAHNVDYLLNKVKEEGL